MRAERDVKSSRDAVFVPLICDALPTINGYAHEAPCHAERVLNDHATGRLQPHFSRKLSVCSLAPMRLCRNIITRKLRCWYTQVLFRLFIADSPSTIFARKDGILKRSDILGRPPIIYIDRTGELLSAWQQSTEGCVQCDQKKKKGSRKQNSRAFFAFCL